MTQQTENLQQFTEDFKREFVQQLVAYFRRNPELNLKFEQVVTDLIPQGFPRDDSSLEAWKEFVGDRLFISRNSTCCMILCNEE